MLRFITFVLGLLFYPSHGKQFIPNSILGMLRYCSYAQSHLCCALKHLNLQERQRQALQEQRQREAYVERELQAQRELQTRRAAEHQLEQQQQEALLVALQQQGRRQQQKLREQERRLAQQQQAEQQAELERRMQQLWCAHLEQQNQYNKAGRKQDVAGTQAEQIDDALEHAFKQQQAQHAQQAAHQQRGRSLRGKDELLAQRAPQLQAEQLVQEAQQATQQQHGKSQQGEDEVLVQRACQLQAEQLTQQAQQAQQAQRAQQAQQTQRAQQAQRAELRHQQQVQHAAQQAFAQAAQQPQQHASHKSPHHDPEPEHAQRVHRMKTSPDEAAVCIQSHYKGYRIRSEKPMLNALAKANHKLTHIFSRYAL